MNNFTTYDTPTNPPLNGGLARGDSLVLVESQNLRRVAATVRSKTLSEQRFELLNQAANILNKHHGRDKDGFPKHRTAKCCNYKSPHAENIEIHKSTSGNATFHNLETCSNVWACPVCSARISEIRRVELNHAVAKSEYHAALLTFTLSHKKESSLIEVREKLTSAYHHLCGKYSYKQMKSENGYVHAIRALEVTRSERHGWHPHFHVIALFNRELSPAEFDTFAAEMSQMWTDAVDVVGGYASKAHGFDAKQADEEIFNYINKMGKEPIDMKWDISHEALKGQFKNAKGKGKTPFQLLAESKTNPKSEALYLEYVDAMKGQKQLVWSRGLKAELGIEEIADELLKEYQDRETELLMKLTDEQWKAILHFGWRGRLLAYASRLDIWRLRLLVGALLRAYRRHLAREQAKRPKPKKKINHVRQVELEVDYSLRWTERKMFGIQHWVCNYCGTMRLDRPKLEEVCCE